MLSQHLRDVTDPEHPYTLEQLNVVTENHISVSDAESYVRCEALSGPPDVLRRKSVCLQGKAALLQVRQALVLTAFLSRKARRGACK